MIAAHKIRIYPSKKQEILLKKSCGVARFAYNWGLATREEKYKNGEKITSFELKKLFNSIKKTEFPFVCEVSKCAAEDALLNLNAAVNIIRRATSEFTCGEKSALAIEPTSFIEVASVVKLDSLNRELYILI